MKVILTGAAGFIGSCFLRKLNDIGIDRIYAVDAASSLGNLPNLKGKKFKDYFTREELLSRLEDHSVSDTDAVIHLGACSDTTETDRIFLSRNNFEYSKTLAQWALGKNKLFHYASSASVYGDGKQGYKEDPSEMRKFAPLNPYAASKWNFDNWVLTENLWDKVTGYRYFNVFGPNERHKGDMRSMVCKAFDQIREAGKARLFATTRKGYPAGSEERDFVYVKDANEVMAYFLGRPEKKGVFNVGTGKARSFKDLATAVFSALGQKPNIEYIPMPEKLRGQYQYFTEADLTNLRKAGYDRPFMKLEDSVTDYVKNYLTKNRVY